MKERIQAAESRFVPRCAKRALGWCLTLLATACLNPLPDDLPAEKAPAPAAAPGSGAAPQGPAAGLDDTGAEPPATTTSNNTAPDNPPTPAGAGGSSAGSASAAPDAGPSAADAGRDAAPELEP